MGYAKPTQARLIDQRARRRATQALIEAHRDEYDRLYAMHRIAAETEAEELAAKAKTTEHAHATTTADRAHAQPLPEEPPRLMPGARKPGETPIDRIDVARCPHCVKHHDRGHICGNCGARPAASLVNAREVREYAATSTVEETARHFGLKLSAVQRLLATPPPRRPA